MTAATSAPRARPASTPEPPRPPVGIGATGWLRWAWRRLTSMRTAVVLLALLGVAAIPGSLLPQRNVATDPAAVAEFYGEHPDLAPWLDRLSFFDVYASSWFAAIYLLLLVSMLGCVLPRCRRLWGEVRARPALPSLRPRRDEDVRRTTAPVPASVALDRGERWLRRRRFRVRRGDDWVVGERGYVREVGNLVFHLSLLVLLVGIGAGRLLGYEARVAVVEGDSFVNAVSQYDDFTPSVWTDVTALDEFSFTLEEFTARFETTGPNRGEPRDFLARLAVEDGDGTRSVRVRPNHPLVVEGTKAFLTGHGYAPRVTVRDGTGTEVFSGTVVFLPADEMFMSDGVVKAPDARPRGLGFEGLFLPTAARAPGGAYSAFPGLANPRLLLTAWVGDLGLDEGAAQSVFVLDKRNLEQVTRAGSDKPLRSSLAVGETFRLPDGQGSITFDGVERFANFQVARDPGKEISLVAALMLLVGLTTSLVVRRRRLQLVVEPGEQGDRLVFAGRALTRRGAPPDELDRWVADVSAHAAESDERPDGGRTAAEYGGDL